MIVIPSRKELDQMAAAARQLMGQSKWLKAAEAYDKADAYAAATRLADEGYYKREWADKSREIHRLVTEFKELEPTTPSNGVYRPFMDWWLVWGFCIDFIVPGAIIDMLKALIKFNKQAKPEHRWTWEQIVEQARERFPQTTIPFRPLIAEDDQTDSTDTLPHGG